MKRKFDDSFFIEGEKYFIEKEMKIMTLLKFDETCLTFLDGRSHYFITINQYIIDIVCKPYTKMSSGHIPKEIYRLCDKVDIFNNEPIMIFNRKNICEDGIMFIIGDNMWCLSNAPDLTMDSILIRKPGSIDVSVRNMKPQEFLDKVDNVRKLIVKNGDIIGIKNIDKKDMVKTIIPFDKSFNDKTLLIFEKDSTLHIKKESYKMTSTYIGSRTDSLVSITTLENFDHAIELMPFKSDFVIDSKR